MGSARVVRAVYDEFARGNVEGVLTHLDAEVEWRLAEGHPYAPAGEPLVGHAALVEGFFARAAVDWERFAVDVRALYDAGDVVVAEVRYSGRFVPTGRELDAQGCHVWRVREEKVTGFQQYVDTNRLQEVTNR